MAFRIAMLASLPLVAFAGMASAGDNALAELFAAHPDPQASHICMTRHYDRAHLAAHPEQNVTEMLAYVGKREGEADGYAGYVVNVRVRFRDSRVAWTFSGDCGREIGKTAPIGCGIDCDGGGFELSLEGRDAVALSIPSRVRISPESDEETAKTAGLKPGDRTFTLQRTALEACIPVIHNEALKAGLARGAVTQ